MRISIIAVSRRRPPWLRDALEDYLRRLPPELKVQIVDIAPGQPRRGESPAKLLAGEAGRIVAAIPEGAHCIVLDETGRGHDTRGLARALEDWRQDGRDIAFVIGGAEGTDAAVKAAAHRVWSLSPLTLPHGLALLLLVEQIYRASTIISGHPYHRE